MNPHRVPHLLAPLAGLVILLGTALPLRAQSGSFIAGRVVDQETGEGVADAMVLVEGTGRGGVTSAVGLFELDNVPPGDWTNLIGFQRLWNRP